MRTAPELVIVDYKTGRSGLDADDARGSQALALYAYAAERVFRRPCRRVELHHLPTGTVAAHEHTEESLERHLGRAAAIAEEASAADAPWRGGLSSRAEDAAQGDADAIEAIDAVFPPSPGPMCSWCDVRRHCPAGARRLHRPHSVGRPRQVTRPGTEGCGRLVAVAEDPEHLRIGPIEVRLERVVYATVVPCRCSPSTTAGRS